jgi:hypothetical protein
MKNKQDITGVNVSSLRNLDIPLYLVYFASLNINETIKNNKTVRNNETVKKI